VIREIVPTQKINAKIRLPGSKYIANRLLPLCALAKSKSLLTNIVDNDDINTAIAGLTSLGYQFKKELHGLSIIPRKDKLCQPVGIYAAHSGTFSRFVSAMASLEKVPVTINCSNKMATRPMVEMFDSLKQLAVNIQSSNDCLPATFKGPMIGTECQLNASRSSQYLSALLIVAPMLPNGLTVKLSAELVSRAYVDMTIKLMSKMSVQVKQNDNRFIVRAGQSYQGINYDIPCDPVSSTYFMAAAVISGGQITINGFDFDSVQGESQFYKVLEKMGVKALIREHDLTIIANQQLNAIEIDMSEMPDAVQTLAVIACFASGSTRITNIKHLAYKESNRIEDTAHELRKTGIKVETGEDYMLIHGGNPLGAEISTHEDHRMAMSMALLGIKTPGIKIIDPQVVEKSFPDYWEYLSKVGIESRCL
jgi:3-phosphoshikimate 1-carboxyvinyltransferase